MIPTPMSAGLSPIDDEIWEAPRPFRAGGMSIGTRMTVIRLPGDRLWLHSPVRIDEDLTREIDALGKVAFLVAPNKVHHLMLGPWAERYPEARLFGAPGLARKRPDLTFSNELGEEPADEWKDQLSQVFLEGAPIVNETVFLHRPSKTLVATDLVFNVGQAEDLWTKLTLGGVLGATGGVRMSRTIRYTVRDRARFRTSVQRALAWDFTRVTVTHGDVIEHDAKASVTSAAAWLGE
jgi:hypothetical protein